MNQQVEKTNEKNGKEGEIHDNENKLFNTEMNCCCNALLALNI